MANLYEDILEIARDYMGIAAKEYIERRCRIVLGGSSAEEITIDKLERLSAGIEMTAKAYIGRERAEAFRKQIEALRHNEYQS